MGGGSKTTEQRTEPWGGQQPYLADLFRQSQAQFGAGPQQYYPGNLVAPFSPQTQTGLDMLTARSLQGAPYESAFQNYLTGTLGQGTIDPYSFAGSAYPALGGMQAGGEFLSQ